MDPPKTPFWTTISLNDALTRDEKGLKAESSCQEGVKNLGVIGFIKPCSPRP